MKYYYYFLVLILVSACSNNSPTSLLEIVEYDTLNIDQDGLEWDCLGDTIHLPIEKLGEDKVGDYTGTTQKLYKHKRPNITLHEFISIVMMCESGIDSIITNDSIVTLYIVQNEENNYFEDADLLMFSWKYYYFHDIYYSFFSFSEIKEISVLNNNSDYTLLPASGDFDNLYLPNNRMRKKWYSSSRDYTDYINIENSEQFEKEDNNIVLTKVLNELSGE